MASLQEVCVVITPFFRTVGSYPFKTPKIHYRKGDTPLDEDSEPITSPKRDSGQPLLTLPLIALVLCLTKVLGKNRLNKDGHLVNFERFAIGQPRHNVGLAMPFAFLQHFIQPVRKERCVRICCHGCGG